MKMLEFYCYQEDRKKLLCQLEIESFEIREIEQEIEILVLYKMKFFYDLSV